MEYNRDKMEANGGTIHGGAHHCLAMRFNSHSEGVKCIISIFHFDAWYVFPHYVITYYLENIG